MSRPQTHEKRLLYKAEQLLCENFDTHELRLQVLEMVAALKSKCDIKEYWKQFEYDYVEIDKTIVAKLFEYINQTEISFSLAISSLAREPLSVEDQKKNGVFYTDFRLAKFMAKNCEEYLKPESSVADLAAGTGILLAGVADLYRKKFPDYFDGWISKKLYAFDLSAVALRGARAAILSMTNNIVALKTMSSNWKLTDSLMDETLSELNIDIIIGNPPWGKIKLSRHDYLAQKGEERTYGSEYDDFDQEAYKKIKEQMSQYSKQIKNKYNLLGNAEPDMYMAFLQRVTEIVTESGHISFLVPAGLIRSQGTQVLRQYLIDNASKLEFVLLDNQANYFSIDTRFKFVQLSFDKKTMLDNALDQFYFSIGMADSLNVKTNKQICFNIEQLKAIRPDLTVPEVRTEEERDLFFRVCKNGRIWGSSDDIWFADIVREVDMTNNRKNFELKSSDDVIPVIEGRMVQQHRFGTKTYVSGSGRSAKWEPCSTRAKSQFFYPRKLLSEKLHSRIKMKRAGYCDIAGQTNERAMMSALIPEGVVCGNKVPTIIFPNDLSGELLYLWIGVTNSFVFDWMIRRIISTTVNYFLLFSIPMPSISIDSKVAIQIIQKTKQLSEMNGDYYTNDEMAELRSEIDVLVADAYNLGYGDMKVIMNDFPIMDRKQPGIMSEKKSTVTTDLVLSKCEKYFEGKSGLHAERYAQAKTKNAKAYIPTEMTELTERGGV